MSDTRWLRWLRSITGKTSLREIAQVAGVSHTQVRRWALEGVPHKAAWDLTVRLRGDPALTCVLLGYVEEDEVHLFNYEAVVKYAPSWVLTAELDRRAQITRTEYAHIKLQERRAVV